MNIANWIIRAALSRPTYPAVGHGHKVVQNYHQLGQSVCATAGGLLGQKNLNLGDRVGIISANTPQYIETIFAIWHAGLIAVPINAKLHQSELDYILNDADVSLCFVSPEILAKNTQTQIPFIAFESDEYRALLNNSPTSIYPSNPTDTAWLFYTSGTTGKPKGAMLSHRNLMAMSLNYFSDFDKIEPGDTIIHPAPLSHGAWPMDAPPRLRNRLQCHSSNWRV